MFRLLKANEIECRVSTVKEKGLSLLLYKDARCDMNILDETVTPLGWQRSHSRDNANCTVSIWSEASNQWIAKEDTGTQSFTEKEKGLASDSFKRACFNWGIGRELYTAPFIWITACDIKPKKNGGGFTSYDRFYVSGVAYNKNRVITNLTINNAKTDKAVFTYGNHISVDCNKLIVAGNKKDITPKAIDRVCMADYGHSMEHISLEEHDELLKRLEAK